jgi:hypothetical protein
MNRNGTVWVQRIHGRLWAIVFKDGAQYEQAFQRHRERTQPEDNENA